MSVYSFKKEATGYVVFNNEYYNITLSAIDFSQTLAVKTVKSKNLHAPNALSSKVAINKYNPASFSLSHYAIRENDFKILFNRALDAGSFDLYVQTQADTFKAEGCVITSAQIGASKNEALGLNYSGEAKSILRVGDETYTIPGTEIVRDSAQTYNRINYVDINFNTTNYTGIVNLSVELQNKVKWVDNDVIGLCGTTNTPTYPDNYVVEERVLAGSFTTSNITNDSFGVNEALDLTVGQKVGAIVYGFNVNSSDVSYTTRINTGSIFTQSFDWRVSENPSALSEIFTYTTYAAGTSGAILDYLGEAILDYQDEAILEN